MTNKKTSYFLFPTFEKVVAWHGTSTQRITSLVVKSYYHSWFFPLRIVPLILHRATQRLLLLVREKERSILTFLNIISVLQESVPGITKCGKLLLQSASGIAICDRLLLRSVSGITKSHSYYKVRRNTCIFSITTISHVLISNINRYAYI